MVDALLSRLDRLGPNSPLIKMSRKKRLLLGIAVSLESALAISLVTYVIARGGHFGSRAVLGIDIGIWLFVTAFFLGMAHDPMKAWKALVRVSLALLAVGLIGLLFFLAFLFLG